MPTDVMWSQADLDGGQPQVVDRAVLEAGLARRPSVCRGTSTDATPIVPPANHGRRSRASASCRAISEPIPVG